MLDSNLEQIVSDALAKAFVEGNDRAETMHPGLQRVLTEGVCAALVGTYGREPSGETGSAADATDLDAGGESSETYVKTIAELESDAAAQQATSAEAQAAESAESIDHPQE